MHITSSGPVEKLAHAVHLNAARDAEFERRDESRAALDAWRRARSAGERASAAVLVLRAAERYGLRPVVGRADAAVPAYSSSPAPARPEGSTS